MSAFLANENVPRDVVEAARQAGIDLEWVHETAPGAADPQVLAMALADNRVLVTFDKDFGELAFRLGLNSSCGVVLLRPRLRSPQFLAQFVVTVLQQPVTWQGHFAVALESQIRVLPLP
jgi:predicted nuclease of predicted toxin-antitoxin system